MVPDQCDKTVNRSWARVRGFFVGQARRLEQRSIMIPRLLERGFEPILLAWLIVFILACVPKVMFPVTPIHNFADFVPIVLPYLLIALAPAAGYRIARKAFPIEVTLAQPEIRLSRYGRWRDLSVLEANANPAFGPNGFMASLLIGLLLNVVVRSFEFLVAVPATNAHAPAWGQQLFHLMAADVVVMSFFYAACFVMALRSVPYFPRMLLFAWGLDIFMQLIIAREVGAMPGLPQAVAAPLHDLLLGNICCSATSRKS